MSAGTPSPAPREFPAAAARGLPEATRQQLLQKHAGIVKHALDRLAPGLPRHVDRNLLLGRGIIALTEALDSHPDPEGPTFASYAAGRVWRTLIDSLRAEDWLSLQAKNRAHQLVRAMTRLQQRLDREPTDEELCAALHIAVEELGGWLEESSHLFGAAAGEFVWMESEAGSSWAVRLQQAAKEDPPTPAELHAAVAKAVSTLPARERLCMALLYYEELTIPEVADVLGTTEQQVRQLHGRAAARLRARLGYAAPSV